MITLMYLKYWFYLTFWFLVAAGLEYVFLRGTLLWTVLAELLTVAVYVLICSALVSDWRAQRGSAFYRFDTVRDVTSDRRW